MTQLQRVAIDASQLSNQQITLSLEQQHYLSRVLRLRQGDRFIAMDGQGHRWLAALQPGMSAQVLESLTEQTELPVEITLLIALPKTGMDEVVRQATELGVRRIGLVNSERSLLQPSSQKLERWRRIAQEAAEQSERQIVPEILPPQSLAIALTHQQAMAACLICEGRNAYPHLLTELTASLNALPPHLTIAIGPEGGWTEAEIEQAIATGYRPVSLGARILRAVTAPLAALAVIGAVYEANGNTELMNPNFESS